LIPIGKVFLGVIYDGSWLARLLNCKGTRGQIFNLSGGHRQFKRSFAIWSRCLTKCSSGMFRYTLS
jgi:hypothetical protein